MNSRSGAIQKVAQLIINRQCYHPLRVAIDGMDAAGKTTLVEELALVITANGRPGDGTLACEIREIFAG